MTQLNTNINFNRISKYYKNKSAKLLNIHIVVYWVMKPCNLAGRQAGRHQCFTGTYHLHPQGKSDQVGELAWGQEMDHREEQWPIRATDGPQVGQ
jgi:hypothetical protein